MTIYNCDCRDGLAMLLEADSVDSIVTDPPYELTRARRTVPPPSVEGSPFSRHRVGVNGDCKPVGGFMGNEWDGTGVAFDVQMWREALRVLKPAWEPIVVVRKPLIGTVAANVLAHGTGAINIDGCRVGTETAGWGGGGSALYEGGLSREGGQARPVMGRWPANLIHDGSEEVLACFPETKSGALSPGMNIKATSGWSGGSSADRVKSTFAPNEGSAARFFYCAKASKAERGAGNTHPTVKPVALMRYLLRLVTQPGGLAVDPFTGSGSTAVAAAMEGFQFVGFELSAEYAEIARARVAAVTK